MLEQEGSVTKGNNSSRLTTVHLKEDKSRFNQLIYVSKA